MPQNLFQRGYPTFATARNKFATAAAPPDQKSVQKVKLFTLALKNSAPTLTLHIFYSVSKKCPNLVVSWMGVQRHTFSIQFHSLSWIGSQVGWEKKGPKLALQKCPDLVRQNYPTVGEAITTDNILTLVNLP